MGEHIPYPSTLSFDNFKQSYIRALTYTKPVDDESEDKPVDDEDIKLISRPPRVGTFLGTIKLHGTNATIVFVDGNRRTPQLQARTWVIADTQDNQGTRALLSKAPLHQLIDEILRIKGADTFKEIYIAGEVAGKGIQKGVAISEMERFFAIFNIRVNGEWVDMREFNTVSIPSYRIFNIAQYPTFTITADFRIDTTPVLEKMMEYTMNVAKECPFGASFMGKDGKKFSGVGEGIVWTLVESKDSERPLKKDILWNFKTKGEQFSTTNATHTSGNNPKAVNTSISPAVMLFADYALTDRRFEQGLEYLLSEQSRKGVPEPDQNPLDIKGIGQFLKWVADDAIKEERNKMKELNADEKGVRKECGARAKAWFLQKGREAANENILVEST